MDASQVCLGEEVGSFGAAADEVDGGGLELWVVIQ